MTDTYFQTGIWRTSWTGSVVHRVVGRAPRNGRARYMMVKAACGKPFNPGGKVDPTALPEGFSLCTTCQARTANAE